jgi:hypothetical protein
MTTTFFIVQLIQQHQKEVLSDNRPLMLVTLHGCMSSARHCGPERARVILQHELEWMKSMELECGSRAAQMRDRLVSMAAGVDQYKLGYSLSG